MDMCRYLMGCSRNWRHPYMSLCVMKEYKGMLQLGPFVAVCDGRRDQKQFACNYSQW